MEELFNGLLDISRLDAGVVQPRITTIPLAATRRYWPGCWVIGWSWGIELLEMLRNEFNVDIPALLVTGDTAPDRLRDAQVSGLTILHKPLNPARLRTLIANLLREHPQAA